MDPYQQALEERIRDLIRWQRWLQDPPFNFGRVVLWPDIQQAYHDELRALLRVRSTVRRQQRVNAKGDHFVGMGR